MSAEPLSVTAPLPLLKTIREQFGLSQDAFAALLGCSPRTIQSTEQGWRNASPALERLALLLFVSLRRGTEFSNLCCWETNKCPTEQREQCLTYRFGQGHLCWFHVSTMCSGRETQSWEEKREMCLRCSFFKSILGDLPAEWRKPDDSSLTIV